MNAESKKSGKGRKDEFPFHGEARKAAMGFLDRFYELAGGIASHDDFTLNEIIYLYQTIAMECTTRARFVFVKDVQRQNPEKINAEAIGLLGKVQAARNAIKGSLETRQLLKTTGALDDRGGVN